MIIDPSPQQRRAIEAPPGPVLVVAGPGAGKTFCLIGRVRHLIEKLKFRPDRICAVTFTNKAAEEIVNRLRRELGSASEDIACGTLHALCLNILREHSEAAGLGVGFGVADEDYQRLVLRRLGVPERRLGQLLVLFGRRRFQGYGLTAGDERLFDRYLAVLRSQNLLDFDGIVTATEALFLARPEVAEAQAGRWDYLLVDEFQDLNLSQYAVLARLAARHRNVFVVGDDEQSIYAWAGADPQVLKRFRDDIVLGEPILLDRNRRCARQIFDAARRLITRNPALFGKVIEADRDSPFDVLAFEFPDEQAEAQWIVEDLTTDRITSGLSWGAYAILYRKHQIGHHLEQALVAADIPCRLARGQALLDDPVITFVVDSLRVMTNPTDPVALETFAARTLPRAFIEELRAFVPDGGGDFLSSVRVYARRHPRTDPDTRKAWRFIYHIENLQALLKPHESLSGLVSELLSQRLGRYRNPLEERYDELTDPVDFPGAAELAERLDAVGRSGGRIWIEPHRGLEIGLQALLSEAGAPTTVSVIGPPDRPGRSDLVVRSAEPVEGGHPLRLFKALQLLHSKHPESLLQDFVAFDLETTDKDPERCEIVEIGAVRVRQGQVADEFHSLVRPTRPISARAREIHGYRDEDLLEAPSFAEVWPRFRDFVGPDVLVAHNAHTFDIPVLRRLAEGLPGEGALIPFDTLPLARSLFRASARLADLATRFGVDPGRSHRALDDARTLAQVFGHLRNLKAVRARKAALANLLDHLGLALALEDPRLRTAEAGLLLDLARVSALGRYGRCLERYEEHRLASGSPDAPPVEEVIERLGGRRLRERLHREKTPAERYPAAVSRLTALVALCEGASLQAGIRAMLDRVTLSSSEGVEADPHRVNLLTLHSTKGLEFSRVYVAGVEDYQLPGYHQIVEDQEAEIQEARRLLYVGMTRARDRLVLTRVEQRGGKPSGGGLFLGEMGIEPVVPEPRM